MTEQTPKPPKAGSSEEKSKAKAPAADRIRDEDGISPSVAAPGQSRALAESVEKHREEVHAAILEQSEKRRSAAAEGQGAALKSRAESFAKRESEAKKVEAESVKVKSPLSTTQEFGIAGVTYYIPPGESEIYPAPGEDIKNLRARLGRLRTIGIEIVAEEPEKSKVKAKGAAAEEDEYEPSDEEIDSVLGQGTDSIVDSQPLRKPSNNGTMTEEAVKEAQREWAKSELKRIRKMGGGKNPENAFRRIHGPGGSGRASQSSKD